MHAGLAFCVLCVLAPACSEGSDSGGQALEAYCPIDAVEVEARIDEALRTLTLEEKASLMHGLAPIPVDGTWQSTSIPEKGIPGFHMLDGPKGVGGSSTLEVANGARTTAFPAAVARSATFSPELEERVGAAIAEEARAVGADTLLAPGMNLAWHPFSGRNQDYYGEDPFLAGEMGLAFVRGVQRKGVLATAKHFAANHIEDTRLDVNVIIDERTLRENFLPQFRKLVQEGQVASVMSAYNQLNGTYCSENAMLLGDILKGEWGFSGFVMSDFFWGTHSTVPAAKAGLDLEMQTAIVYGDPVVDAVNGAELDLSNVDGHVRRILRAQFCYEIDANPPVVDESKLETEETLALAREVATRSIVLLRNDGLLPLSKTRSESIVLVGPLADLQNIGDTDGSSGVKSSEVVTIADGLLGRTDVAASIEFLPGELSDPQEELLVSAADLVIVALGLTQEDEGEGQSGPPVPALGAGDRDSYGLPGEQAAFLTQILSLNRNVIVVLEGGSAIDMSPWFADTRAVLMAWYPGVQGGHAIADVLFGDANPSGRLPVSFPARIEDLQAFPGLELDVTYERYHGYQRLDKNGTAPFAPFGFGLSYSTFEYDEPSVDNPKPSVEDDSLTVAVSVRNASSRAGIETVQVYAGAVSPSVDMPVRKLVGFSQVSLEPGENKRVELEISVRELAYFQENQAWVLDPGLYRFELGSSVADLPVFVEVQLR